jgi:hypothetical protein
LEARFVIQEGGELQRAREVELGVKRVAVNEFHVWPFDPDLNSLARHDRGGESLQRNALGVLVVAPDQLGPSETKLVERKDDALRAVLFFWVKVDDFLGGGAVLELPEVSQNLEM